MGASSRLDNTSKAASRRQQATLPVYDGDTPERAETPFDWAEVDMDLMAATPVAVLTAGDMISFTMDRGGYSVLVTLRAGEQSYKKWCNDAHTLNKHLLKTYDNATARRNALTPPKLPLTTG